ncbi:hypothetical protein [Methylogaea oryzae]|uniref:Uncharacterized protein n=2 Tax=Methylogaea oryzae TaxID=1295382 RepID=A0A8D4VMA2_9GAMM|nr:hypothetical protein [Methylogaea oryzae]BBL69722.1 hypothetical protein MoryE10_03280 [Methylogaea oryzae]
MAQLTERPEMGTRIRVIAAGKYQGWTGYVAGPSYIPGEEAYVKVRVSKSAASGLQEIKVAWAAGLEKLEEAR